MIPKDAFGFKDEFERVRCLQWLFFWHRSVMFANFAFPPPPFSFLKSQNMKDAGTDVDEG
jgi:hypothetical protein